MGNIVSTWTFFKTNSDLDPQSDTDPETKIISGIKEHLPEPLRDIFLSDGKVKTHLTSSIGPATIKTENGGVCIEFRPANEKECGRYSHCYKDKLLLCAAFIDDDGRDYVTMIDSPLFGVLSEGDQKKKTEEAVKIILKAFGITH